MKNDPAIQTIKRESIQAMPKNRMRQARRRPHEGRSGGQFLPDFCAIRAVFGVVITAELLAVLLTLAAVDGLAGIPQQLSILSLLVQWIALSTAALLCLMRTWLQGQSDRLAGMAAWGLLQLVTLLVGFTALWLHDALMPVSVWETGQGLLPRALGISVVVGWLLLHYLQLQYRWRQQLEAENEARLQALQSRIRPHFLFNSMNTIASLTRSNPLLAEEVVEDLADLFRVSLGDAGHQSRLGRELELARQYLNIERHRLGQRLRVDWDLQGLPLDAMLPPLILQPLLENAVYHGIEPAAKGGVIHISGRYRRGRVNLGIRNTIPNDREGGHHKGNRLALENIRERLEGLFGMQASLTESRVEGDHQVRLVIPHPWRLQ
jgi:two-component system sensor histidine kinase AlgZ